jgi:hypothetical protein
MMKRGIVRWVVTRNAGQSRQFKNRWRGVISLGLGSRNMWVQLERGGTIEVIGAVGAYSPLENEPLRARKYHPYRVC